MIFSFKSVRVDSVSFPHQQGSCHLGSTPSWPCFGLLVGKNMLEDVGSNVTKFWKDTLKIYLLCINKHISACRSNTPHDDTHILELVVVKSSNIRARISVNSFWTLTFFITFHCLLNCTVWYHVAMYLFHMFFVHLLEYLKIKKQIFTALPFQMPSHQSCPVP